MSHPIHDSWRDPAAVKAEQWQLANAGRVGGELDLSMRHVDKQCIGEQCEPGHACRRHERTTAVVRRYLRRYS